MILSKFKNVIRGIKKVESLFSNKIFKQLSFLVIILFSFGLIYQLNILHPLFGDDWGYALTRGYTRPVSSFSDIFFDQYQQYFSWGGRVIVHIIAQTLFMVGIPLGDLLNSVGYVLFTLVIYYLANGKWEAKPSLLIIINLLIWFFAPKFGSTILWITGSANYLWGTMIILAFLIPYRQYAERATSKDGYPKAILFFLLGIIAGWTNENMAVALITMLIIFLVYFKIKNGFIPKWAIAGLIGSIIGCTLMVIAPGNYVRYRSSLDQTTVHSIQFFITRFIASLSTYYYYAFGLTFILALLYITFLKYANAAKNITLFIASLFFLGAIIATFAMTASPIFPPRAVFGLSSFLIVSICILYANLDKQQYYLKYMSSTIIVFALLFFITDYLSGYKELKAVKSVLDNREQMILEGKKVGVKDFVFTDVIPESQTRFFHYWELPADTSDWHNQMYSKYYGINSVKIIRK